MPDSAVWVCTYDEYCIAHGVSTFVPCYAEYHNGAAHMSGVSKRRAAKRLESELDSWARSRMTLSKKYQEQVVLGTVRPPTRLEKLTKTAKGTDEAAKAAQRIIERMRG